MDYYQTREASVYLNITIFKLHYLLQGGVRQPATRTRLFVRMVTHSFYNTDQLRDQADPAHSIWPETASLLA